MDYQEKIKNFYAVCLVFISGIFIASFLLSAVAQIHFIFFCFFISTAIIAFFIRFQKIRIGLTLVAVLFFALWRYALSIPQDAPDMIWFYNGQSTIFNGIVDKEPDARARYQKLEVSVLEIFEPKATEIQGQVLLTTDLYPRYAYGDELEIACDLEKPEPFSGFDYDRYLARHDIFSVCYYPKISKIESNNRLNFKKRFYQSIFALKDNLRKKIDNGLSEAEANLAKAIILGDKNALTEAWRNIFSASGISHVVAISGMHISILSALAMAFLIGIGLKRQHAFYAAILFLAVYILLIGLPASAMRAGLMGFCVLWALKLGRISKLINSLLLAAVILLLLNPRLLRDDVGFQLSFLAVLGISYIFPWFKKGIENFFGEKISRYKIIQTIIDILGITLAAQVFTLPIIYYNFGSISLVAPLTNLLVLWALPFLMIFLLLALFLGSLFPAWLIVIFFPAKILLSYILFTSHLLGVWKYAVF